MTSEFNQIINLVNLKKKKLTIFLIKKYIN